MTPSNGYATARTARATRARWIGLGLVLCLALVVVGLRIAGYARFEASTFIPASMGPERPTDYGIAFEPLTLTAGDRQLSAWWVPAPRAKAAVLVWHGQGEALSHWTHAIKRLYDNGMSVLVFDYAGYGDSTGKASVERLREDSAAAVKVFENKAAQLRRYLMAYSMGAGVMLDHLRDHPVKNDGVVLVSAWSSIREVAMASGGLPKPLVWMVPDVYNNVEALAAISGPVFIVHSRTVGRFPVTMAQSNLAARAGSTLVLTDAPAHSDFLTDPKRLQGEAELMWENVLHFLK